MTTRTQRKAGRISLTRDTFRLALFAIILISVGRVHQHFGFLAALHPAKVFAALALFYAVLKPGAVNSEQILTDWPSKIIVALAVLACISAPFGLSLGGSGMFVLTVFAKVIVLALLLIAATRDYRDLFTFVWAYVISCGILVVFALTVFQMGGGGGVARLSGGLYMYDPNDLGLVLITGLPLAVMTYRVTSGWKKIISVFVIVGIGAALALTGSRGGFLGLVAVGGALLFMLREVPVLKRVALTAAVALGLFAMTPSGYWDRMETMMSPTEDYNWTDYSGRKQILERGVGYMLERPFLGVGIGNFERAEGTISERAKQYRNITGESVPAARWLSPHNSYLEVGAELGVSGLLLWSGLLFGGIFSLYGLRRRLPASWKRGDPEERFLYEMTLFLPVAFFGFAVTCTFVSFAFLEIFYILAAYVSGLYISLRARKRRATERSRAPDRVERRVPYSARAS